MTHLRSAALTDIGRVRQHNEDRLLHEPELQLYGVADGVGGLPGGEEASQTAIESILASARAADSTPLAAWVHAANRAVRAVGHRLSPTMGIGSTLTFGRIVDGTFHIAHVGDSRAYLWHRGELMQLTDDHSVENEAKLRRAKGEVVYYHESDRNALTRCIGQNTAPQVDLVDRKLRAGERYLFCTDGVTRMVRDAELQDFLEAAQDPEETLRAIIALAIRRGGPDNATGVLVIVDQV